MAKRLFSLGAMLLVAFSISLTGCGSNKATEIEDGEETHSEGHEGAQGAVGGENENDPAGGGGNQ